jgi:Adenylosuccinate lyase (EC 4.3.2.2)
MPAAAKQALADLTPMTYTGDAEKLARDIEKLI